MAYVEVRVDIEDYLDEVDASDLIEELKSRDLSYSEINEISSSLNIDIKLESKSVLDEIKINVIMNGYNNKTLEELESFFKIK